MTRIPFATIGPLLIILVASGCETGDRVIGPTDQRLPAQGLSLSTAALPGGKGLAQACRQHATYADSALIGPAGGTLRVGLNELIVPPGALGSPTMIVGTVPEGTTGTIRLEPSGLRFKKPAGLRLDVTGCDFPEPVPDVIHVDDDGTVLQRIEAVFSNAWKAVAAPIEHFSAYQIAI